MKIVKAFIFPLRNSDLKYGTLNFSKLVSVKKIKLKPMFHTNEEGRK